MNGKVFSEMGQSMVLPNGGTIPMYFGIVLKSTVQTCQCNAEMIMLNVITSCCSLGEIEGTGWILAVVYSEGLKTLNRQK